MTIKYCTVDVETNGKNKGENAVGKFPANPHHPDNNIVHAGFKYARHIGGTDETGYHYVEHVRPDLASLDIDHPECPELCIGHNIKFDLLYLLKSGGWDEWLKTGVVWDTMLAEYIITGQETQMASLDALSLKYGGTIKDGRLKEMWNAGIDTEDIDADIVLPYLEQDVRNTELIYKQQIVEADRLGMLPLIRSQMDALLATLEMEYNGIHVDKVGANTERIRLETHSVALKQHLINEMQHTLIGIDPNPNSNDHVSLFLFGGDYNAIESKKVGVYKTGAKKGQDKYRKLVVPMQTTGTGMLPLSDWTLKKKGFYSVSDEVLEEFITHKWHGEVFCTHLQAYRALNKDIRTHYVGYSKLVWPHDSCLHPNFNHALTDTGRLSHSAPNVGNVPHDE